MVDVLGRVVQVMGRSRWDRRPLSKGGGALPKTMGASPRTLELNKGQRREGLPRLAGGGPARADGPLLHHRPGLPPASQQNREVRGGRRAAVCRKRPPTRRVQGLMPLPR